MTNREHERFMAKVVIDDYGCWVWVGARLKSGYGKLGVSVDGKWITQLSHRLAFEHWVGPIPAGTEIDHQCRVRSCCNPAHLRTISHAENVRLAVWSEAARARIGAAQRGRIVTAETRSRMAVGAKAGWLKRKAKAA